MIKNENIIKGIIIILSILIIAASKEPLHMDGLGLFYAAITSVIVTNVDFKNLIKNSWERMLGTIIGGIVGVIFSYAGLNIYFQIIMGEIMVMYVCEKLLKIPSAIGSIIFLIIIFGVPNGSYFLYGVERVLDTFYGILITLFVAYIGKKIKLFK